MACSCLSAKIFAKKKKPKWEGPFWEGVWPCLDPSDSVHTMADENAFRSSSDSSPDLGDMWRYGCPKSPVWSSNGVEWAGSKDASSLEYHKHNVGNLTIEVVRQNWSSEVISLFLEDWEVGRVALRCHLSMGLLCQEMRDACWESSESLGSSSFTVF